MSKDTGIKETAKVFTVAVASGKGGTGKTTVAISLAMCSNEEVQLLDCDVEEPNAHIFLNPGNLTEEQVSVPVPFLDESKCTGCGKCNGICAFNAIAFLEKPLFFPDLCHSCGLCAKVCPEGAIMEVGRNIGKLETGVKGKVHFVSGCMNVGTAMSPPVIRAVKEKPANTALMVIDCPPGTACAFVASVKKSDFVLIVTEPTPFGLHDMTLAIKVIRQLNLQFGVLVNKSVSDDDRVGKYCKNEKIALLMRIPEDRGIAEAYSRGIPLLETIPEMKDKFEKLLQDMKCLCSWRNGK